MVGSGGREHALAWKLAQSPDLEELHAAPGNPGIAKLGACHPVRSEDAEGLLALARALEIDLIVIGPETPLVAGVADRLRRGGIAVFGPSRAAAQIEGSKIFAKEVMTAAGVPTAETMAVARPPCVIKADGLAAGLARAGYGVFLFDFRNLGLSDKGGPHAPGSDLVGAVDEARRRGAERVILFGGSYGGTAVLAAAPDLDVAGVVALSPPPDLSNWIDELDAVSAVRRLRAPMLILYAADDWRTPPAAEHALARAAGSKEKQLVEFPGYWHAGALLYKAPFRARAKRLVLDFIRAHADGR